MDALLSSVQSGLQVAQDALQQQVQLQRHIKEKSKVPQEDMDAGGDCSLKMDTHTESLLRLLVDLGNNMAKSCQTLDGKQFQKLPFP